MIFSKSIVEKLESWIDAVKFYQKRVSKSIQKLKVRVSGNQKPNCKEKMRITRLRKWKGKGD